MVGMRGEGWGILGQGRLTNISGGPEEHSACKLITPGPVSLPREAGWGWESPAQALQNSG